MFALTARFPTLALIVGLATAHLRADEPTLDPYLAPLPMRAKARLGISPDRMNGFRTVAATSSPDGKRIAAILGTRVIVWDLETDQARQHVAAPTSTLRALAFADNDTLLTQGREGAKDTVKVWNARTGKMQRSFELPDLWRDATFSHDGKLLAFTSRGGPTVHVWDTQMGKQLYAEREHNPALCFSADDRFLVSSHHETVDKRNVSAVTLREARTGKIIRKLQLNDEATISGMSADGQLLIGHAHVVLGHPNNWLNRWRTYDAETGKAIRTLIEQRSAEPRSIVFAPTGRLIAGADLGERGLSVWDADSGARVMSFPSDRYAFVYPQFSHDGKTLLSVTIPGRVSLHDLKTQTTRSLNPAHDGQVASLAFTPDGKHLASSSPFSEIFLWEVASGSLSKRCKLPGQVTQQGEAWESATRMAFAPDGKHLLTQQADHKVRLFAPFHGKEVAAFRAAGNVCGFSDDGRHLLWLGAPASVLPRRHGAPGHITADDLDGVLNALRWAAFAFALPEVGQFRTHAYSSPKVENVTSNPELPMLGGIPTTGVSPDGLSPDGSLLLETTTAMTGIPTSSMGTYFVPDGTRLSDRATGKQVLWARSKHVGITRLDIIRNMPPKKEDFTELTVLQLAPDSRSMICVVRSAKASASGLKLCEVRTGKERLHLSNQVAQPELCAFSRDGRWVAFTTAKNAIELFDLMLGKTATTFEPGELTTSLAFSPDGALLASGGQGGTILLWDLQAGMKRDVKERIWSDDEKARLWKDLMHPDAAEAFAAMMRLKSSPAQAVELLKDRLDVRDLNEQIPRQVEQLNSNDFTTRKKASDALKQFGERVRPILVEALAKSKSLEHKRRVEALLATLGSPFTSPASLRQLRAIELLDGFRSPEAAALLSQLSKGLPPTDPLAREVARALGRK